jgi:hypothetical protein
MHFRMVLRHCSCGSSDSSAVNLDTCDSLMLMALHIFRPASVFVSRLSRPHLVQQPGRSREPEGCAEEDHHIHCAWAQW